MDTCRLTVFIFTLFCACFGRENKRNCDPGPFIEEHEGRKACVYLNYQEIKTIGVGYNMQNPNAPEDFRSIDADYDKFNNGPTTPWNVKCNCSAVPCLLDAQTNKLFALTLTAAVSDAQKFISNFAALCCPVQNVVVDMAFTFGIERLYELEEFASLIEEQYWKAAADYLSISKWCLVEAQKRCSEDAAIVNKGCGCFGPYPQACDARASTCCGPKSEMTCCKGTIKFDGYITKTFDEIMCCQYPNATCCPGNRCCSVQYPVCCPPSESPGVSCCPADYPICKDGKCHRPRDGAVTNGKA